MKKVGIFVWCLALILALSSWAPALATTNVAANPASADAAVTGPITLTINNPLPKATTVTLTGPKTYTIYVTKGATITRTIDAGKYKVSYAGCLGKPVKGNLKVKGIVATLNIKPCKMANWIWTNPKNSSYVTIRLNGWVSYNVSLAPGQTVRVSWVAGKYDVTFKHCGKTFNEKWNVSGKKSWIWLPCE